MAPDTLQGGFLHPLPEDTVDESSRPLFGEDDDDREVTAITALEIEQSKANEAVARMKGISKRSTPPVGAIRQALTPPPTDASLKDPKKSGESSSTWNMRAIYNNSVFDIGMSITLAKEKTLTLQEAVDTVVPRADDVVKVNVTLITGELDITSNASRYRTLERQGQVVTFSRYSTDFSAVEFTALTSSTRLLLIAWRPPNGK